mgnify:CR=1 FL=1
MTTCTEFVARLASPGAQQDQELAAHLAGCADCRALAKAADALAGTTQTPPPERLAHFATRTRATLLQRKERSQRLSPLLAGAFAVAGAAAVALILDVAMPQRVPAPVPNPPAIAALPAPAPAPTPPAPAVDVNEQSALEELAADLGLEEEELLALLDDADEDDEAI